MAVLQVDAERLAIGRADDVGVSVAAAQVHEAADEAEHFPEVIGTLPGDGERRDRA
jgi:hypothetical protein